MWWDGDPFEVATRLVGSELITDSADGEAGALITEAEVYLGADDPASHAYRGQTPRNTPMFGPAGTLYVYRSYGIHWCINVVTGPAGAAGAILVRAGQPSRNVELITQRRGRTDSLCDGPGKLCQALGIDDRYTGAHLEEADGLRVEPHGQPVAVQWCPRIGLSRATDKPFRAVLTTD